MSCQIPSRKPARRGKGSSIKAQLGLTLGLHILNLVGLALATSHCPYVLNSVFFAGSLSVSPTCDLATVAQNSPEETEVR